MEVQTTSIHGLRQSTNGAFIRPIRYKRKNLKIVTQAHVIRILINPETRMAYGVEYLNTRTNFTKIAYANKEVILSAGTINSPKILMLSGVGPAEHLHELGIPLVYDSAVGYNLQDHTTIDGVVIQLNKTSQSAEYPEMVQHLHQFRKTQGGPLASTGPLTTSIFVQTPYEDSKEKPDIQYSFDRVNTEDFYTAPAVAGEMAASPLSYYDGLVIRPILMNPNSRGVIKLNNTDPLWGAPEIHANTFSAYPDLDRIVSGVEIAMQLFGTKSFMKNKDRKSVV